MQTITRSDGKTLTAVVSSTNADKPVVIIIQEWWGINDQMKKRALKFEEAGFRTILPDLYHGKVATQAQEAKHLFDTLNWPEAFQDLHACVQWARANGATKVAITGYCMGGALTLGYAAQFTDVDAIAPFYGLPSDALDLSKIQCPVQGHFAEIDDWCGPEKVEEKLNKKLTSEHTIYTYKGAHHAFTNENRPEVYDAKATEIALDRTMVFFGSKLF